MSVFGGQPLQRVQGFQCLARAQGIRVDRGKRVGQRIGRERFGLLAGEQRKVVEPGGDAAGRIAARFQLGEHGFRSSQHNWRNTGQLGNRDSIASVSWAFGKFVQQDRTRLDTMVDEELVFIEGSGKRSGKAEFIAGWTGAGDKYDPITLIDRTVTPTGKDSFVVSAETTLSGESGGKRFSSRFRFSDTFRRKEGRWQAVHIQVTRIVE